MPESWGRGIDYEGHEAGLSFSSVAGTGARPSHSHSADQNVECLRAALGGGLFYERPATLNGVWGAFVFGLVLNAASILQ